MSNDGVALKWGRRLCTLHDAVTTAGFAVATACLAIIVVAFCFEVVARYMFDAPTTWVSSLVAYLLCAIIFLVLPQLTRQRAHIFISVFPDMLPGRQATRLIRAGRTAAVIACLLAAWFCADATYQQYVRNVDTLNEWRVPKWMVSVFIPYGLFSAGLYYLRQVIANAPYDSNGGVTS